MGAAVLLAACGQSPPSWDILLSGKILGQYPTYTVTVPEAEQLRVERPGMPTKTLAVNPIAQHCLRGPKDCNYAVEQMLVELRDPCPALNRRVWRRALLRGGPKDFFTSRGRGTGFAGPQAQRPSRGADGFWGQSPN